MLPIEGNKMYIAYHNFILILLQTKIKSKQRHLTNAIQTLPSIFMPFQTAHYFL